MVGQSARKINSVDLRFRLKKNLTDFGEQKFQKTVKIENKQFFKFENFQGCKTKNIGCIFTYFISCIDYFWVMIKHDLGNSGSYSACHKKRASFINPVLTKCFFFFFECWLKIYFYASMTFLYLICVQKRFVIDFGSQPDFSIRSNDFSSHLQLLVIILMEVTAPETAILFKSFLRHCLLLFIQMSSLWYRLSAACCWNLCPYDSSASMPRRGTKITFKSVYSNVLVKWNGTTEYHKMEIYWQKFSSLDFLFFVIIFRRSFCYSLVPYYY